MLGNVSRRFTSALVISVALVAWPGTRGAAQTLKDQLKEHMREGVEEEKQKQEEREQQERENERKKQAAPAKQPSRPAPARPNAPPPNQGDGVQFSFDSRDDAKAEPTPEGPALPIRVIGDKLQLDITVGGGYRGWLPQRYRAVAVDVGNYGTWNIDVKAKIFKYLSLHRGYYESNGVAAPRTQEAAVASKIGSYAPKAMRALGVLGVPISKAWEPQIRYESYGFETRAFSRGGDVCVVSRAATGNETDCPGRSDGELKIVSGFETLVAGVQYDHGKSGTPVVGPTTGKIPPIFFGLGLMQYRKPYQLNVNGNTLDDYLFDSRFRGIGLALGTVFGGGVNRFFGEVDVQFGAGEVSLSDQLKLNDVIPNGYVIGYLQGTGSVGYRWAMIEGPPTLMLVPQISLGGADFFLVSTNSDNAKAPSPSVNWDFLWSAHVSLLVPL